jgi:hypothetical protein
VEPLSLLLGGLLGWFVAKPRKNAAPPSAHDGDLLYGGAIWRPAAIGTQASPSLYAAVLAGAEWYQEGDWAASRGKLYFKVK